MTEPPPAGAEAVEPTIAPPVPPRWKSFALAQSLPKIALELFIVFVGVSAAFAVDDFRDAREDDQRRTAVYLALDRELKQMAETHGPLLQQQMTRELSAWDQSIARGEKPVPPTFRLPGAERPPTGVWDAAVATGTIELIDAEMMFELARFYNRARFIGDLRQRYSAAAESHIWPHLDEGPTAFWEPDGDLRPEAKAHLDRIRVFRERQRQLGEEARLLRQKLKRTAED